MTPDAQAADSGRRASRETPGPFDPVLPGVEVNLVRPTEPAVGRVVESRLCTAGGRKSSGFVRHVAIDVSGTTLAGRFRAGQSFGVVPPGLDENGRPHQLRLYSIASPTRGEDGAGGVLSTTVKRLLDEDWETHRLRVGVCSNHLCDAQLGDEIRVTGPSGKRFLLPEDPSRHDYVFFATGTGIAPFRGLIGDLAAAGAGSRVVLVMGAAYRSDLLYDDELRAAESRWPWFRYLTAISREAQDDTSRGLYVQDRVRLDPAGTGEGSIVGLLRSDRTLVYICGLAGMELGILGEVFGVLGRDGATGYLSVDDDAAGEPRAWTKRMINRSVRPTRRVFLEVY